MEALLYTNDKQFSATANFARTVQKLLLIYFSDD